MNFFRKIVILFIMYQNVAYSQVTFSVEKEKFLKEIEKFLSGTNGKKTKEFISDFTPFFMSEEYDEDYTNDLVFTVNKMVSKKLKSFPDVYNYMLAHMNLKKQGKINNYEQWKKILLNFLNSRNQKNSKNFLQVSSDLLSTEYIYTNNQKFVWGKRGGDFEFIGGKSPKIEFKNTTLFCKIRKRTFKKNEDPYYDSLVVYGTNGAFDLKLSKWKGAGGIITWEKVGLNKKETYAEITNYQISLKSTKLSCGNVTFYTPYFSQPLEGKLIDYTAKINREADKVYPSFDSKDKKLFIKDIVPNVYYTGGFSMRGDKFVGMGSKEDKAFLTFYKDEKPFVNCKSLQFTITSDKIKSQGVDFKMNISDTDSITHPGAYLTYYPKSEKLELSRGENGVSQSPFSDTYHQLDIYVGQIIWEKSKPNLVLTWNYGKSIDQRLGLFESKNFYNERLYNMIQGMQSVHPLLAIYKYAYKYDEFHTNEGKLASVLNMTTEQAKPLLLKLSTLGFLSYDVDSKKIIILDKIKNFIDSRSRKKDYDNLIFKSDLRPLKLSQEEKTKKISDPKLQKKERSYKKINNERARLKYFGTINLSTFQMNLNAVNMVEVSSIQKTVVFPDKDQIVIYKNRDFEFKGWLVSGKVEILVEDVKFNYDEFKFDLQKTKTLAFRVFPMEESDGKRSIGLRNEISEFKGILEVNHPNNKSGKQEKVEYNGFPKLISDESSKIYYNSKEIYRGVYDSTRFYYTLEPFTIDSLLNFDEKSFELEGELISAGIFPVLKEPVRIMKDYSLGFITYVNQEEGFDFYGNEAKYKNKIVLSANGLQGQGDIHFETSKSISKKFTFFPDSTVGFANYMNKIRLSGIEMPEVSCKKAFITYVPKNKLLKVKSTKEPLLFFDGEAKFRGTTYLKPSGMKGSGIMNFSTAKMLADVFKFTSKEMESDTCAFKLKDPENLSKSETFAFSTAKKFNGKVSFVKRNGIFKSNDGESEVLFPSNKFLCKMDMFTWQMDKEEIELSKTKGSDINIDANLDLAKSNFYSTNPSQDSLSFKSLKAIFLTKEKVLICNKTEFIDVADARIFPDSQRVIIRKNAEMDELKNAKIVANYITKYHKIVNATTKILAKRSYKASGDYQYYDIDSNVYIFHFKNIRLDSSFQTIAEGKIKKDRGFKLSPQFDFYGNVYLNSSNQFLTFKGATRINHNCDLDRNWMSFKTQINPQEVQIPVSKEMKNLEGQVLTAGMVLRNSHDEDSIDIYPTFLSEIDNKEDEVIITADGVLKYDVMAAEFQISRKEKFLNRSISANFISLHTKSCSMFGEGKINLGMKYGDLTFDPVGIINYNQVNKSVDMNVSGKLDFAIDKGIWEKIAINLNEEESTEEINFEQTTLEQSIASLVGQSEADKIKSDYNLKGEVKKIYKQMNSAIYLTNLKLKWDKEYTRFISSNKKIGVVSVFGKPVFKKYMGKISFRKTPSVSGIYKDQFNLLIETPSLYYFLNYDYQTKKKIGKMRILTSDSKLKESILNMKFEKKKKKRFEYDITSNSVYLSRFRSEFEDDE